MKVNNEQKTKLKSILNVHFDMKTTEDKITLTTFESESDQYWRENHIPTDPDTGRPEDWFEHPDFEEETVEIDIEGNEELIEAIKIVKSNNDRFIHFEMTGEGALDETERKNLDDNQKKLSKLLESPKKKKKNTMRM